MQVTSRTQASLVSVALTLLTVFLPSSLEVLHDYGVTVASFRAVTRQLHRELSHWDLPSPLKPRRNFCPWLGYQFDSVTFNPTQLHWVPCIGMTKNRPEADYVSDAQGWEWREMKATSSHAEQGSECPEAGRSNEMGLQRKSEKSAWRDRAGSLGGTEPKRHNGHAGFL